VNLRTKWEYAARHPTWSALIAFLIGSAILYAVGVLAGYFKSLPEVVSDAVAWLGHAANVPNWAPVGLGALTLLAGAWAVAGNRRSSGLAELLTKARADLAASIALPAKGQKPPPSPLLEYRTDDFEGVRWRWRYAYDRLDMPDDLKAYCPTCDIEITPQRHGTVTTFGCRDCRKLVAKIPHPDNHTVQDRVKNLITRELRRKGAEA